MCNVFFVIEWNFKAFLFYRPITLNQCNKVFKVNEVVNNDCSYLGVGRPGSVPFVSNRPGAYSRLLLAVYVRWKTGLLVSFDWLRPVTRGAWRAGLPDRVHGSVGTS